MEGSAYHGDYNIFLTLVPRVPRARQLFGVAKGLEYLHSLDIAHGDLKGVSHPSSFSLASLVLDFTIFLISWPQANVVIDQCGRARLTEYGLALIISNPDFATPGGVGASRWLAPEITNLDEGDSTLVKESKPADVFAFAMLALEAFTGRIPFEEQVAEVAAHRISRGDRPKMPTNAQKVGLTIGIWKLLESCWHHDPKKRPPVKQVVRRWQKFVDVNNDNNVVTGYVQITRVF